MKKTFVLPLAIAVFATSQISHAEPFSFDRPGEGLGTAIVPKGHVAWEQSLPTASFDKVDGVEQTTVKGDMLLRVGVGANTEVRVGWDGPIWQRNKSLGQDSEIHGNGDINIGVKKGMETGDERLNWALLAQATLATGDKKLADSGLTLGDSKKNIYSIASTIEYDFDDNIGTGITMQYDYQDGDLAWAVVPNLQYKISERTSGYMELKYRKQESQKHEVLVNQSLIWAVTDKLSLDATFGMSFNEQNPKYNLGFGAAYLF